MKKDKNGCTEECGEAVEIIAQFDKAMKEGRVRLTEDHPLNRKRQKEPFRVSYHRLPKYIQKELKLSK